MPNRIQRNEMTQAESDSIKTVSHTLLTFKKLWDAYPDSVSHIDPKTNKQIFSDSCAIKVSHALYSNGILLKSFKGVRCWSCSSGNGKNIHAIRAQELADYLQKRPFAGCPKASVLTGKNFEENIKDKQGIVFFQNYWRREGETGYSGDHIDLWNKDKLASLGYFRTRLRFIVPAGFAEDYLGYSDLTRATQVLFWEMT